MRKLILSGAALIMAAFILVSFTAEKPEVVLDSQTIVWTGKKLTGSHSGTLDFSEANIEMKENKMVAASFVVDMTSMKNTDLDEEMGAKLIGHLSSNDFFGIADHPTASFVSTKIESRGENNTAYKVTGDMTIKGITKTETFKVDFEARGNAYMANANIMIDRTKYDVRYGSGKFFDNLGDKAIFDDFNLAIRIVNHGH